MIMAIATRAENIPEEKPFDDRFYLTAYFKKIFDDMGILLFPLISDKNLSIAADMANGLILPGSYTDIDPSYYGHQPLKGKNYTKDEYKSDMAMIRAFEQAGKPILGICGGMQSINVYFGGTLHQQIPGHFTDGAMQAAYLAEGSFLHSIYRKDQIQINSFHNQAVDKVAPGFKVTARAKDGITEAIEGKNIIGVQWHPEVLFDTDFFRSFVNMCIPK